MRAVVPIPDRDPGDAELARRIAASSAQRAMLRATLAREFDHATEEAFGFDGERCGAIVAAVLAGSRIPDRATPDRLHHSTRGEAPCHS
jgi:hypothetical protein